MARKPKPVYTPVEPVPAELSPEDLWRDGALPLKAAAAFLGRKLTLMRRLVAERKVPAKRDGKLILVAQRGLVLYLAALPNEPSGLPIVYPKGSFLPRSGRE